MKSLTVLSLSILAQGIAFAAPIDDFYHSTSYVWGVGSALPAPYTQQDMNVEVRINFGFIPLNQTTTASSPEQVITKAANSYNLSLNAQSIDPTAPNLTLNLAGTPTGSNVLWTFNQTFSQTGGFPVSTTVNINGVPTAINLVLNDVNVNGRLRADFSAVTPFFNATAGRNAKVRGTYMNGDTDNLINMVTTNIQGTINGLQPTRLEIRWRQVQHIGHVPYTPVIQGSVMLNDQVVASEGQTVHCKLYSPNSATVLQSADVVLGAGGAFSLPTDLPVGSYRLAISGPTHLAQLQDVALTDNVSGLSYALTNGDVDGDNEVGPSDFAAISAAFGTVTGDSGYSAQADLDKDGEVGPSDFSILTGKFGEVGDEP